MLSKQQLESNRATDRESSSRSTINEESDSSMVMHMEEYASGNKPDLQARLWNMFVRPKFSAELEVNQRQNPYTRAILVT